MFQLKVLVQSFCLTLVLISVGAVEGATTHCDKTVRISAGDFTGRSVVISDGEFRKQLKSGDMIQIIYKSGRREVVVVSEISHRIPGERGESAIEFSYVFVPVMIEGQLSQVLLNDDFLQGVLEIWHLRTISPKKFPKEHSSNPGHALNRLLRSYFVDLSTETKSHTSFAAEDTSSSGQK